MFMAIDSLLLPFSKVSYRDGDLCYGIQYMLSGFS